MIGRPTMILLALGALASTALVLAGPVHAKPTRCYAWCARHGDSTACYRDCDQTSVTTNKASLVRKGNTAARRERFHR